MVSSPTHERNPRFTEKPTTSPLHQQRERVREAWRRPKAKVSQHRQYLNAKAMIKKVPEDWQLNLKMSMPHIHERQHFVSQLQPPFFLCSLKDAVQTFNSSGLNDLVIGDFVVSESPVLALKTALNYNRGKPS